MQYTAWLFPKMVSLSRLVVTTLFFAYGQFLKVIQIRSPNRFLYPPRASLYTLTIDDIQDNRRRPRPSIPIEIIPRLESRSVRTGIPRGFFDDVERTYPPRRSANGGSPHAIRHSRIKDLVNRLPFRRQLQQAQNEEGRSRHWNGFSQFLRQRLSFRRPSQESQEVEVAAGRKFTRLAVVKLPEYKKVNDTRHVPREQPGVSQNTIVNDPLPESSDIDSLPDVHWLKAFLCYYSCWSHGRLRMPPRWRLERVDLHRQDHTTSRAGAHVVH